MDRLLISFYATLIFGSIEITVALYQNESCTVGGIPAFGNARFDKFSSQMHVFPWMQPPCQGVVRSVTFYNYAPHNTAKHFYLGIFRHAQAEPGFFHLVNYVKVQVPAPSRIGWQKVSIDIRSGWKPPLEVDYGVAFGFFYDEWDSDRVDVVIPYSQRRHQQMNYRAYVGDVGLRALSEARILEQNKPLDLSDNIQYRRLPAFFVTVTDRDFEIKACGGSEPPNAVNAWIDQATLFDNAKPGDCANYICDPGYMTWDNSFAVCQPNGTWSNLPFCKEIPDFAYCPRPPTIKHGHVVQSSYPADGWPQATDWIRFACFEGFYLDGNSKVLCSPPGWTKAPSCRRDNSCGPKPEVPPNSHVVYEIITGVEEGLEGDVIHYECENGFFRDGAQDTTVCEADLYWSPVSPCLKTCGRAPLVPNSFVVKSDFKNNSSVIGSSVSYSCENGYSMVWPNNAAEKSEIRCGSDGKWNTENLPRCVAVQSPNKAWLNKEIMEDDSLPPPLDYDLPPAKMDIPDVISTDRETTVMATTPALQTILETKFSTDDDFAATSRRRKRTKATTFNPTTEWMTTTTTTLALQTTLKTKVSTDDDFANTLIDSADSRFVTSKRDRTKATTFEPTTERMTKEAITLTELFTPSRATTPTKRKTLKTILTTATVLTEPAPSTTTEIMRTASQTITSSKMTTPETPDPDTFFRPVLIGSTPVLPMIVIDEINDFMAEYSLPEREISCGEPPSIDDAFIHVQSFKNNNSVVGSAVAYLCVGEKMLEGPSQIVCGADGKWPVERPRCVSPLTCGPAPDVPGTYVYDKSFEGANSEPGSFVRYKCVSGMRSLFPDDNSLVIKCGANGRWPDALPQCAGSCDRDPPTPLNMVVLNRFISRFGGYYGNYVSYVCKKGFIFGGPTQNSVCQIETLTWSPVSPCVRTCNAAPGLLNGFVFSQSFERSNSIAGSTVTYACNRGFEISYPRPGALVTCKDDGTWAVETMPICKQSTLFLGRVPIERVITCGAAPEIANGRIDEQSFESTKSVMGSTVTFTCNEGYYLSGNGSVICGDTGQWAQKLPECIFDEPGVKSCGGVPRLPFATVEYASFEGSDSRPGSIVRYKCSNQEAILEVKCDENGEWPKPFPTCRRQSRPIQNRY